MRFMPTNRPGRPEYTSATAGTNDGNSQGRYMRVSHQKALAWFALAVGAGGTLLIIWAMILEGWPSRSERFVWFWLVGTVLVSALALLVLKRAYRLAPTPRPIQVILADLVVSVTVFASVLLVGSHVNDEKELFRYWLLPALVLAFCYLSGVTHGAQLGLYGWRRYPVAVATAVTVLGCLGMGAFLVHAAILLSIAGRKLAAEMVLDVFGFTIASFPVFLARAYRVCLCAVPIGLLLTILMRQTILRAFAGKADEHGKKSEESSSRK